MNDQLQVDLHDAELRAEIEMTTELMIAAADAPGRLSDDIVDGILGLRPPSLERSALPRQRGEDGPRR